MFSPERQAAIEAVLEDVVTVSEAAWLWGRNEKTVRDAIGTGRVPLIGRKSGVVWLVSVESLRARWGEQVRKKPYNPLY